MFPGSAQKNWEKSRGISFRIYTPYYGNIFTLTCDTLFHQRGNIIASALLLMFFSWVCCCLVSELGGVYSRHTSVRRTVQNYIGPAIKSVLSFNDCRSSSLWQTNCLLGGVWVGFNWMLTEVTLTTGWLDDWWCKEQDCLTDGLNIRKEWMMVFLYIWVSVHQKSIIYNKPARCNSGSIVFINK